ncbi:MAG: hypothetical protein IPN29_06155 [Saprospiraceae bacterium]|nr:hypothetical protein [Saprospiraceae bacterium]
MNSSSITYIIGQLGNLADLLHDRSYSEPLDVLSGSTIGKHVRHIHDFYKAIAFGLEDKTIDYNCRERNEAIELDFELALQEMKSLDKFFEFVDMHQPMKIIPSLGYTQEEVDVHSSMGRELMYAFDHAIHHLALIRIGIESVKSAELPASFGLSPSTILYQQKNG